MASKRDVTPILQFLRNLLLQRKNVNYLRFRDEMAARTQPDPILPEGPHHKLSANYYYTRDARRAVKPDEVVAEGQTMLKLGTGEGKPISAVERVPGRVHLWDI